MSLVGKLLAPSHVLLDLQASSKKRLFEQAGLLFENHDGIGALGDGIGDGLGDIGDGVGDMFGGIGDMFDF